MHYRIGKKELFETIGLWNGYVRKKVNLIACGGTALTLLGIKDSTKDIDIIVPNIGEYDHLIKTLMAIGYKNKTTSGWARDDVFIFDIFRGNRVHTTELIESPLIPENNIPLKRFSKIYLGILNYYDLIITKLFRGTSSDVEDCLWLFKNKNKEIDLDLLQKRFYETASYDISEKKVIQNLKGFIETVKEAG